MPPAAVPGAAARLPHPVVAGEHGGGDARWRQPRCRASAIQHVGSASRGCQGRVSGDAACNSRDMRRASCRARRLHPPRLVRFRHRLSCASRPRLSHRHACLAAPRRRRRVVPPSVEHPISTPHPVVSLACRGLSAGEVPTRQAPGRLSSRISSARRGAWTRWYWGCSRLRCRRRFVGCAAIRLRADTARPRFSLRLCWSWLATLKAWHAVLARPSKRVEVEPFPPQWAVRLPNRIHCAGCRPERPSGQSRDVRTIGNG